MKYLFVPAVLTAALSGCAVVSPYDQPYDIYSSAPVYPQPYAVAPVYVMPAPIYGPPVQFSFGLNYWSGGGGHHGHHHGFGGFGGGRHGWRH
jgi:hypothetical protein